MELNSLEQRKDRIPGVYGVLYNVTSALTNIIELFLTHQTGSLNPDMPATW